MSDPPENGPAGGEEPKESYNYSLDELYDTWTGLDPEEAARAFYALSPEDRVSFISALPNYDQERIIDFLNDENIRLLLKEMAPDDLVDMVQNVSSEIRRSVWENLSEEMRRETLFLLRFDEDDAAGLMTPRYLAIKENATVGQALRFIRTRAEQVETIYYIYVVDAVQRLRGVLSLRALLTSPDDTKVSEIMKGDIISVREDTDQEEVAQVLETHDFVAVPVVDDGERLLGIVTFDDVMDVIRDEHTEDVYKMGAMDGIVVPYLGTSVWGLVKKRIPWLVLLLILGTVTTNVLHHYESIVIGAAFLFVFMPVITQTGGNTGGQISTLVIRGLATGEIRVRDFLRVLARELLVGLYLGIATGVVIVLRSYFLPPGIELIEAGIIGLSLLLIVLFSNITGAIAPLIIYKLGFDPTVVSAPLMSTLIDVCGITIYFETAKLLLGA